VPHKRRFDPVWRRQIFAERLEHLADETVRRPVGEANLALRPAHAQQLGGRLLLVRREHDAERRQHHVKARVRKGQRLGIRFLERDVEPFCLGALAAALEKRRHVVRGRNGGKPPRRRERGVAVAGGNIEHPLARAKVDAFAEQLADNL
jgi:hypothetical protein